ncbi:hypothetical protein GCM10010207_51500 [Streptomyces atratus]|nr:hypothetical protein GCM10010207_51500 [Streptomyces atratus]
MPEEPAAGKCRKVCGARLDTAPQTSGSHLSATERARLIGLQERLDQRLAADPLLAADTLLGGREPSTLRERVQPLVQAAYERAPKRAYQMLRGTEVSASGAAWVGRAVLRYRSWTGRAWQRSRR